MTITDERRLVTVLFADLVGFTGRVEQSDPEAVRDLQRAYFAAVAAEVERFGGTIEKFIGDAAMAIFGAPVAHDDDAERALRTALSIRDAVASLEAGVPPPADGRPDLEVRIGVNTGEVVGGMAGPGARDYTVSGDAVNVAARLQQTAQPNEILVGGTTRALSAEAFAFAPLSQLTLKGRAEPVEAWRLERELPERPRMRGGEARLVGRSRELAAIESALEEAEASRGLMLALVGEAGIGKSRLALEARHRAEANGFTSAWTTSRSYASAFPYHLVGQLVPQLLRRAAGTTTVEALTASGIDAEQETLERWAAVIDDVLGEAQPDDPRLADLSPGGRQRMLVHGIGALLRRHTERQPLLLVLDDLQWADPASLAVVEELLDILPELRMALLATYRTGWSHGWEGRSAYEQLNLRALRAEEAREMASQLLPNTDLSGELAARVLERSAGNPLFLEELLRGESAQDGTEPGAARRLPETIHEMLLARLDALPPDARRTLQLASVVGSEFSEHIVAALESDEMGRERTDDALRALQRAELVVPRSGGGGPRTLAFRHPLIHEVAYRSLLMSARRELHGRIGRWLEEHGGEELLSELARHYRDADDGEKARYYLPLAGARAENLNANREAHGLYQDAAAVWSQDPIRQAEMLEAAARQRYLLGEIEASIDQQLLAVALYESAGVELAALNARAWLGRLYWLDGNPNEADRQIGTAIDGLERLPPSAELAYAYSNRAQSTMLQPNFAEGEKYARKALAVAEATGATVALVHAENNLGTCLLGVGDATGRDHLRRSLDLALEHHLTDDAGRAYANISGQGWRIFPYGFAESEALLREAIDFARRTIPDGVFDQWIRSGYAEFLMATGRWSEAERVHAGMSEARAGAYLAAEHRAQRAHLLAYRGQVDEALPIATTSAEMATTIGDLQAMLPAFAALAAVQAGLGNDAAAVDALRTAVDRRGTNLELPLTSWFLFEAVDTLAVIAARDPSSPDLAPGIELLAGFARSVAGDVATGGAFVHTQIRHALVGAAIEQLAVLARTGDLAPLDLPKRDEFRARAAAADIVAAERRLFDAARIRLWLAEEGRDSGLLGDAAAVFTELGAHPYLARAEQLTG